MSVIEELEALLETTEDENEREAIRATIEGLKREQASSNPRPNAEARASILG